MLYDFIKSQTKNLTVLYALVFLFPVLAVVKSHWASFLYAIIALVALIGYFKKDNRPDFRLHDYEKLLFWFLLLNFIVFLASTILNYPERLRYTRLTLEMRFILVIPVYFLLLRQENALRYFIYGATLSVFVNLFFALYELYYLDRTRFSGAYGTLFSGPVTLLFAVVVIVWQLDRLKSIKQIIYPIVILACTLFVLTAANSRVTFIALFVIFLVMLLFYVRKWYQIITLAISGLIIVLTISMSPDIKSRMHVAMNEITEYFSHENTAAPQVDLSSSSVGTRFEMWSAVPLFLRDTPVFGIGNGNYKKVMQKYVDDGELNPTVLNHAHAHNVFINALYNKGLLGLVAACLVMFYPLLVYLRTYRLSPGSARLGIVMIVSIFIFSLNAVAPFYKSNFIAIYTILTVLLFSHHMQNIRDKLS